MYSVVRSNQEFGQVWRLGASVKSDSSKSSVEVRYGLVKFGLLFVKILDSISVEH